MSGDEQKLQLALSRPLLARRPHLAPDNIEKGDHEETGYGGLSSRYQFWIRDPRHQKRETGEKRKKVPLSELLPANLFFNLN